MKDDDLNYCAFVKLECNHTYAYSGCSHLLEEGLECHLCDDKRMKVIKIRPVENGTPDWEHIMKVTESGEYDL